MCDYCSTVTFICRLFWILSSKFHSRRGGIWNRCRERLECWRLNVNLTELCFLTCRLAHLLRKRGKFELQYVGHFHKIFFVVVFTSKPDGVNMKLCRLTCNLLIGQFWWDHFASSVHHQETCGGNWTLMTDWSLCSTLMPLMCIYYGLFNELTRYMEEDT